MVWPVNFFGLGGGNQPLSLFDVMFNQVAQVIAIPCNAVGQNSISLTPIGNNPTLVNGYAELCGFRFRAAQTTTAGVVAQLTPLAFQVVYLADGLTQAAAGNIQIGQEYVLIWSQSLNGGNGGFFLENAAVPAVGVAAGGSFSGLTIKNNVGTPNTQLDIAATEIIMQNVGGGTIRGAGLGFTVNFLNSGVVNGLDVGAIASGRTYFIWAISNGSIIGAVASLSSTFAGLTFPAGYTFAKLIGAWRTSQSVAQLMGGVQFGTHFQYIQGVAQTLTTSQQAITGNSGTPTTAGSVTSVSLANLVPTIAKSFDFYIFMGSNSGGVSVMAAPSTGYGGVNATTNPPPVILSTFQTTGAGINNNNGVTARGTFAGAGPVFYASSAGAGSGLWIDGWDLNI
jgi:hypothetical protein